MSAKARIAIVGGTCFVAGWVFAQLGGWQAHAQNEAPEVRGVTKLYGQSVRVRSAAEQQFTDQTKSYGLEVVRDENNGNVIYISETGDIAVVPATPADVPSAPAP